MAEITQLTEAIILANAPTVLARRSAWTGSANDIKEAGCYQALPTTTDLPDVITTKNGTIVMFSTYYAVQLYFTRSQGVFYRIFDTYSSIWTAWKKFVTE